MHKSAKLGLFMMSSLIMLVPFATYGNSSYSTYQTEDKKYECRTGPFEGFFVS